VRPIGTTYCGRNKVGEKKKTKPKINKNENT
jgi:hypothetical protein